MGRSGGSPSALSCRLPRIDQRIFLLEERCSFRLDILPELVHLSQVDHPRGQVCFEQVQCAELQQQCVLGIRICCNCCNRPMKPPTVPSPPPANLRRQPPRRLRPLRRRDQIRSPANAAQTARPLTRKPCQTGTSKETTASLRTC